MKRVVLNAKEFVADIRSGKTDQRLMSDYGLSSASLLKVKNELLNRRLISVSDLKNQMGPVRTRRKINADRFLYEFRQRPDDLYLMEKYGLKPHHLRKVYQSLIKRHLLSEFEFESREVRVRAVDEERRPAPAVGQVGEASTVISVVGQSDYSEAQFIDRYRDSQLPTDFFKDYSGIPIGKTCPSDLPDFGSPPAETGSRIPGGWRGSQSTVVEIIGGDYCPKCGALKNPASEDSCLSCGVVYSKAHHGTAKVVGASWKDE